MLFFFDSCLNDIIFLGSLREINCKNENEIIMYFSWFWNINLKKFKFIRI